MDRAAAPMVTLKCGHQPRHSLSQRVLSLSQGTQLGTGMGTQEGPPRGHNRSCQGAKGVQGRRGGHAAFGQGTEATGPAGRAGGGGQEVTVPGGTQGGVVGDTMWQEVTQQPVPPTEPSPISGGAGGCGPASGNTAGRGNSHRAGGLGHCPQSPLDRRGGGAWVPVVWPPNCPPFPGQGHPETRSGEGGGQRAAVSAGTRLWRADGDSASVGGQCTRALGVLRRTMAPPCHIVSLVPATKPKCPLELNPLGVN